MYKCFFSFLILLQFFLYINNSITDLIFDPSLNLILYDDTCIYTTEKSNTIYKMKISDNTPQNFSITSNIKNKTLIKLTDDSFIMFGLNNNNMLCYKQYNIHQNNANDFQPSSLQIVGNAGNHTIKYIKENLFLVYYLYSRQFYLYSLYLILGDQGGIKTISLEKDYQLNNIECDSYDGINIFCVYSIIKTIKDAVNKDTYSTISYYSFQNINFNNLQKIQIKKDIAGPSLLKFEYNNIKNFLICYYEINSGKSPSVYCNNFIINDASILSEKTYFIGTTSYFQLTYKDFVFQNLVQLIRYDYTIYMHMKFQKDQNNRGSALFVATIDLNLIVPFYIDPNTAIEKQNIYVSDDYILFLIINSGGIKIEIINLLAKCPNTTLYNLSDENTEIDLKHLVENQKSINSDLVYLTFGLDPLTYIYNDGIRNMGGLLYMFLIKNEGNINSDIKVRLVDSNIRITYNYYIYHDKDSTNSNDSPGYLTFSNFCLLKILHCYEGCKTCNENVIGTEETNQCSSCKLEAGYFKFLLDSNEKGFFNCYKTDNQNIIAHYFLDTTDNQYYKCDESCKTCDNNKTCNECNEGYYYKEDSLISYNNKLTELCYKSTPNNYYLAPTGIYKLCYKTCSQCFSLGNEIQNKCFDCRNGFKNYPYDSTKCTDDYTKCQKYWRINSTNNIQCIDTCDHYIIHQGNNKNQCVENCQTYVNPLNSWTSDPLLFYECDRQKYCITHDYCKLKKLENDLTRCYRGKSCFNMNDYTPATTAPNTDIKTEAIEPITEKVTIVKYFEFSKKNYSQMMQDFSQIQIKNYFSEYNLELKTHEYEDGIYFITVNSYADFILTVYPLIKEDYLYKNVIKTNNLCFINFNEYFNQLQYVPENKNVILIGLIEFKNVNIPINSINYFFFECEEENNLLTNNYKEINKIDLISDSSLLKVEFPLYNFNNSNITAQYSSNLINSIKTLNILDENIDFFNENNEFYNDICKTFTSEIGTDVTISDRIEAYSTKISLCENGCQFISLIDKGKEDNPRSVCECEFKENIEKSKNNYTFNYEKMEAKNISNLNVLKCVNNVFSSKEIQDNFIFWIFLFLIIILVIIFLIIIFCGKSSVENILKIKKEISENEEEPSKEKIFNVTEKVSSFKSNEKYQSIEVKSNSIVKEIISSKISYSEPPKKIKEVVTTKTENQMGSRIENNSINTTINFNNRLEFKFKEKEDDDMYDEIFPDYNEVLNNNYYEEKYMKNNYINLRLRNLKLKKYFLVPLGNDEYKKHNSTDTEGDVNNSFQMKKRRRTTFKYFKTIIPNAELTQNILKNYKGNPQMETEYDENKKINLKKTIKFQEESDFQGDEDYNDNLKLKSNKKKSIINDSNNDLFIHKKKKSLVSSSNEKKSDISSMRSLDKTNSLDKYFLNSSNANSNIKVHYSFIKFYWIYLNKREFCLVSIYNMQDNVASFIRIATFLFVIALLFTINCLLLTSKQIHNRHEYIKNHGSPNEFTYIFKNEIGTVFLLVLIYLIVKMLFIKFIYGKLFRISHAAKEDLSPFGGIDSEKEEDKEDKIIKRKEYLKKYRIKSLIYIGIIFLLMILVGYISICYFGIFKNSKVGMVIRFLIAFVFSIIFCAILCLIVVIIYHCGRKHRCCKTTYKICKIIY